MALATNHVDRYLPWMLEVIEAYPQLDEVGWSLTPSILTTQAGPMLSWFLVLSTASPLLGQDPLVAPTYTEWRTTEFTFKEVVLQGLNLLREARETLLSEPTTGPNGFPIIGE
jgi:hypothetical protein